MKKPNSDAFMSAKESGQLLGIQDVAIDVQGEHLGDLRTSLPLDRIEKRSKDTRKTNAAHVTNLRQSIAVLGLIEPIVVDQNGRLIAGGHRLEAVRELRTHQPDIFAEFFPDENIPVRVMPFDADQQTIKAMEVEIAENEQRRDYTKQEITNIAKRLKEAGYRDNRGRPKEGEKALFPALGVIVGKSYRSVRRIMSQKDKSDNRPNGLLSPSSEPGEIISTRDTTANEIEAQNRVRTALLLRGAKFRKQLAEMRPSCPEALEYIDRCLGCLEASTSESDSSVDANAEQ
jgi:ParB family transcriptional regulator, chromosome partitioning protein